MNEGEAYVALLDTKLALSLASKPLYLERDSIIIVHATIAQLLFQTGELSLLSGIQSSSSTPFLTGKFLKLTERLILQPNGLPHITPLVLFLDLLFCTLF